MAAYCQLAATSEIVKRFWATVRSAIASAGLYLYLYLSLPFLSLPSPLAPPLSSPFFFFPYFLPFLSLEVGLLNSTERESGPIYSANSCKLVGRKGLIKIYTLLNYMYMYVVLAKQFLTASG